MIRKSDLIELLWGAIDGDLVCVSRRQMAAREKGLFWLEGEWIWIKDLEISLRKIQGYLNRSDRNLGGKYIAGILIEFSDDQLKNSFDESFCSLLFNARKAVKELSNPD
ncbi:hypothetical protein ACJJIF_08925 [Microbulbifer sp. SSSA002]|uniref:hypothetical protein n=1 Tax=unclassified Microbulbifer TaxID=2619833 RepID=UPI004039FF32